ncbi:hypothetical protein ACGFJC_27465 [Nonomuraea fuscirosea]|uniref:hypothetical protein n=1 Tax=Nonomuraea fuscirosea TaxID=1291556 RepID=UPI003427104E
MVKILITGMSGTGKSTASEMLAARGHRAVDTDTDRWSRWETLPDGTADWVWQEPAISELLAEHRGGGDVHDGDRHVRADRGGRPAA